MPPGRAALIAVLGVLLLALVVVVAVLVGRGAQGGGTPTSAATAVALATEAPSPTAAPPTAAPPTAVSTTATPAPAPTGQTILTFSVPQTFRCDAAGQANPYIHLTWTTARATGVSISIDGPGKFADYPANGSADVPFACSVAQHTYLLTTQGTGSPATRTVVVRRVT